MLFQVPSPRFVHCNENTVKGCIYLENKSIIYFVTSAIMLVLPLLGIDPRIEG